MSRGEREIILRIGSPFLFFTYQWNFKLPGESVVKIDYYLNFSFGGGSLVGNCSISHVYPIFSQISVEIVF